MIKYSMNLKRVLFVSICMFIACSGLYSQGDDDCMMCHEDPELFSTRAGKPVSLYITRDKLTISVHKEVACGACHKEAAADLPHPERLGKVNCGDCHTSAQENFDNGLHGQALKNNELYAPDCKECHGKHDILSRENPDSRTYKMNIPALCGKCHREGAPVSRVYNISEHNIIENYSQDIHGKGLFNSGLIVTATCNDCHSNHLVLRHTNPKSSTSSKNIANTCMKCHARIEQVHKKVIKGELWENEPGSIPACSDCHLPHKVQIENAASTMQARTCLKCHEKDDIYKIVNGDTISLKVDKQDIEMSAHKNITCVKCHSDITVNAKRPCVTAGKIDCSNCHSEVSSLFFESGHGKAYIQKHESAPYCTTCHGTHKVQTKEDDTSPIYRSKIPELCGKCHMENGRAGSETELKETNSYSDYSSSVHGKGLRDKGLLVSAVCTDCHTSHFMFKASDERSSVYPKNIPSTCASCHKGIYDDYILSDHAINQDSDSNFPTCATCHSAHLISNIDKDEFMTEVGDQCGLCHKELAETYLETYHGKAYQLGSKNSARCSDCHTAHKILNMENPNSSIGVNNIVATCQKCHEDANQKFTGYLTHATHYNKKKFPALYYTYWAMTFLLIFVFGFFGIHTLLWLPRSIKERKKKKKIHSKITGETLYFRRFNRNQRITHIFVILSFMLLALTGMTLKFANMEWARSLIVIFGGVEGAGLIHRFGAIITFGYFTFHVFNLFRDKKRKKLGIIKFIFSKNSLMFNKQDVKDFVATIKWFVGKGPRPQYGRWTYWEKFDYMAVFWGVAVIGLSGLMLWFPELFSKFLPGQFINISQIIHSDEALLAVGFIFTIHFFNTHMRPESFPMDTVIFTGHVPVEEYKLDRAKEYEELEESGELENVIVKRSFSKDKMKLIKIFGFFFLILGMSLVVLILYSLLAG